MVSGLKIAIVGYGIAGIAASIHLGRTGHRVDHFERRDSRIADGAGLLLQPPTLTLLRDLGVDAEALKNAARVTGFSAVTLAGRTLTDIRYADHAPGSYGLGIQRRHLIELLMACDAGRRNVTVSQAIADVDGSRGILHSACGRTHGPYDLIVAADGANSVLRRALPALVRSDKAYASTAVVACIDDPENLAGHRLVQYFDGSRHVAVWPVGSAGTESPRRANVSINVASAQVAEFCGSGAWKAVISRHCPHLDSLLEQVGKDFSPIIYRYRDVSMRRLYERRLVFIGDAAHSMSPLLGQGARLALLDAATLAQCLKEQNSLQEALGEFNRRCAAFVEEFQKYSRWLTPAFQSEGQFSTLLRQAIQLAHRLPSVAARARSLLIGDA